MRLITLLIASLLIIPAWAEDATPNYQETAAPSMEFILQNMELIGLILGLLAFGLAIWHERELRFQVHELSNIRGSLSTRYIGKFPYYLPEIVQRIENSKTTVLILCDFPAYGSFSDPSNFIRYRHAIERKTLEGVKVKITCFNDTKRNAAYQDQFRMQKQDWNGWKDKHKVKLQKFLSSHGKRKHDLANLTIDEFLQINQNDDQRMLTESFSGAEKLEVGTDIPVFFWIIDDEYAIFAIPGYPEDEMSLGEYGFLTLDQMLIRAFKDMLLRYYPIP